MGAAGALGNTAYGGGKWMGEEGTGSRGGCLSPRNAGLTPVLTPRRRLRRPSGLSSGSTPGLGASPERPASLVDSFWAVR